MYATMQQLVQQAKETPLHKVILENECQLSGLTQQQILEKFRQRWQVMYASAHKALEKPQKMIGDLITGQASRQKQYSKREGFLGESTNRMMAMAFSGSMCPGNVVAFFASTLTHRTGGVNGEKG